MQTPRREGGRCDLGPAAGRGELDIRGADVREALVEGGDAGDDGGAGVGGWRGEAGVGRELAWIGGGCHVGDE